MSYLKRHGTRRVPQWAPLQGQEPNSAGGFAWAVDAWTRLRRFLVEKLGANDPCPCGSGRRFKNCCRNDGRFRRRYGRSLLPGALAAPACLRSSVGRAAGFDPARRGSTPLGGPDTVAEQDRHAPAKRDTAVRVRPVSCRPAGVIHDVERKEGDR